MKTEKELIEGSAPYFKAKEDLGVMYATEDGQYFYERFKHHATNHAAANGLADPLEITRGKSNGKPVAEPKVEAKTAPEKEVVESTKEPAIADEKTTEVEEEKSEAAPKVKRKRNKA